MEPGKGNACCLGPSSGGVEVEDCVGVNMLHIRVHLSWDWVSIVETVEVEEGSTGGVWGGIFILQIIVHPPSANRHTL